MAGASVPPSPPGPPRAPGPLEPPAPPPVPGDEGPSRFLIAVGGNAIHPGGIRGTVAEQVELAARTGRSLLPILRRRNQVVITHGNGPVVGKILMRQTLARDRVAPMSLDICVAHSQGGIAYLLMQALENALREAGLPRHVVCLLTQVEVDPDDPAFEAPSKPIGYFHDEAEAMDVRDALGWTMREDAGRGWRQVVPSPEPRHIADVSLVRTVIESGAVAIAGGGGGIPVARAPDGTRRGLAAVIDKDLTSALMARVLGLDALVILTAVPHVSLHFGAARETPLRRVTAGELRARQREGHFAAGSMAPKVEAAARFVEQTGKPAVIAHLEEAEAAVYGDAGTRVHPDPP